MNRKLAVRELIWVLDGHRHPAAPSETGSFGKHFPNPRAAQQLGVVTQSPPVPGLWESPGRALPCFYGNGEAGPCLLCCKGRNPGLFFS